MPDPRADPRADPGADSERAADPHHWYELGQYHSKQKNPRNAIRAYEQCVALDPTYYKAWTNLAAEQFHLKQYAKAIHACRQALRTNPQDVHAWMTAGAAFFQRNEDGRALFCFHQARDNGSAKVKQFLAKARAARDKLLEADPVNVLVEWEAGLDQLEPVLPERAEVGARGETPTPTPDARSPRCARGAGWKGRPVPAFPVTITCSFCGKENTFQPEVFAGLQKVFCEACGFEITPDQPPRPE